VAVNVYPKFTMPGSRSHEMDWNRIAVEIAVLAAALVVVQQMNLLSNASWLKRGLIAGIAVTIALVLLRFVWP
jgi:hypothetical protein